MAPAPITHTLMNPPSASSCAGRRSVAGKSELPSRLLRSSRERAVNDFLQPANYFPKKAPSRLEEILWV